MPAYLRLAFGPLLMIATAGALYLLAEAGIRLPTPGSFMLVAILVASAVGGIAAGYLTAAIGIGVGLTLTLDTFDIASLPANRQLRLTLVIAAALAVPLIVGYLRNRTARRLEIERTNRERAEALNRELLILRAALDNVDYGVLLLDEQMQARFMNRAFRAMWRLPERQGDSVPSLIDLIRTAGAAGSYTMSPAEIDEYLEWRVERVRAGDESPLNLRLPDDTVIRSQCKVLPGGGRFLSYTDVTDLVGQAERFERLATTDDLTGLTNRRRFLQLAEDEQRRHARDRIPLALLMLDIDLFKSINDRYGHDVGDAVLRHIAQVCRRDTREGTIVARIGGEEFVLLLPETSREKAMNAAERLRLRIETTPLTIGGTEITVTASIGVAVADAGADSVSELMKRADLALYRAKRDGRNRVRYAADQWDKEDPAAAA
jgi:diguanylate cyclase (GGDEF)-like protein